MLSREQERTLSILLSELWTVKKYQETIQTIDLESILETPFMMEIVVQVLPEMLEKERQPIKLKRKLQKEFGLNKGETIWEKLEDSKEFIDQFTLTLHQNHLTDLLKNILKGFTQVQLSTIQSTLQQHYLTRYDFYETFMHFYYENQINKMRDTGKEGINYDTIQEDLKEFARNLALNMTNRELTQVNYESGGQFYEKEETWEDQFFKQGNGEKSYIRKFLRQGIPLKQKGGSYSFNHKSIQEFLVAKDVYDFLKSNFHYDKILIETILEHVTSDEIEEQEEVVVDFNQQKRQSLNPLKSNSMVKSAYRGSTSSRRQSQTADFKVNQIYSAIILKDQSVGVKKDIWDYLLEEKEQILEKVLKKDQKSIKNREQSKNQELVKEAYTQQLEQFICAVKQLLEHNFNKFNYLTSFKKGVLAFLKEKLKFDEEMKLICLSIVQLTKIDAKLQQASTNSITILNILRFSFANLDLSGIKIPNSYLRGGDFFNTNLQGADLSRSDLSKVNISLANLNKANLIDVNLGGYITLNNEKQIERFCYSPNGLFIASQGQDNVVKLWEAQTGKLKEKIEGNCTVKQMQFVPGSSSLIVLTEDGEIHTANFEEEQDENQISFLNGQKGRVSFFQFLKNSENIGFYLDSKEIGFTDYNLHEIGCLDTQQLTKDCLSSIQEIEENLLLGVSDSNMLFFQMEKEKLFCQKFQGTLKISQENTNYLQYKNNSLQYFEISKKNSAMDEHTTSSVIQNKQYTKMVWSDWQILSYSPDSKSILAINDIKTLFWWYYDNQSNIKYRELLENCSKNTKNFFSECGKFLVIIDDQHNINLFNIEDEEDSKPIQFQHQEQQEPGAILINFETEVMEIEKVIFFPVECLCLATLTTTGSIQLWTLTGDPLLPNSLLPSSMTDKFTDIRFSKPNFSNADRRQLVDCQLIVEGITDENQKFNRIYTNLHELVQQFIENQEGKQEIIINSNTKIGPQQHPETIKRPNLESQAEKEKDEGVIDQKNQSFEAKCIELKQKQLCFDIQYSQCNNLIAQISEEKKLSTNIEEQKKTEIVFSPNLKSRIEVDKSQQKGKATLITQKYTKILEKQTFFLFSPDGNTLYTAESAKTSIFIYDLNETTSEKALKKTITLDNVFRQLLISNDEEELVAVTITNLLYIWKIKNSNEITQEVKKEQTIKGFSIVEYFDIDKKNQDYFLIKDDVTEDLQLYKLGDDNLLKKQPESFLKKTDYKSYKLSINGNHLAVVCKENNKNYISLYYYNNYKKAVLEKKEIAKVCFNFSSNGKQLAYINEKWQIILYSIEQKTEKIVYDLPQNMRKLEDLYFPQNIEDDFLCVLLDKDSQELRLISLKSPEMTEKIVKTFKNRLKKTYFVHQSEAQNIIFRSENNVSTQKVLQLDEFTLYLESSETDNNDKKLRIYQNIYRFSQKHVQNIEYLSQLDRKQTNFCPVNKEKTVYIYDKSNFKFYYYSLENFKEATSTLTEKLQSYNLEDKFFSLNLYEKGKEVQRKQFIRNEEFRIYFNSHESIVFLQTSFNSLMSFNVKNKQLKEYNQAEQNPISQDEFNTEIISFSVSNHNTNTNTNNNNNDNDNRNRNLFAYICKNQILVVEIVNQNTYKETKLTAFEKKKNEEQTVKALALYDYKDKNKVFYLLETKKNQEITYYFLEIDMKNKEVFYKRKYEVPQYTPIQQVKITFNAQGTVVYLSYIVKSLLFVQEFQLEEVQTTNKIESFNENQVQTILQSRLKSEEKEDISYKISPQTSILCLQDRQQFKTEKRFDLTDSKFQIGNFLLSHEKPIQKAIISPTTELIATIDQEGSLKIWFTKQQRNKDLLVENFSSQSTIKDVIFAESNIRFLVISSAKEAALYDQVFFTQKKGNFQIQKNVSKANFSQDGSIVMVVQENLVKIFNAKEGKKIGDDLDHSEKVEQAEFSPDGKKIAVITGQLVLIWSLQTGVQMNSEESKQTGKQILLNHLMYSLDGSRLLSTTSKEASDAHSTYSSLVSLWDSQNGNQIGKMKQVNCEEIRNCSFDQNKNDNYYQILQNENQIQIWDGTTGKQTRNVVEMAKQGNESTNIRQFKISCQGNYYAIQLKNAQKKNIFIYNRDQNTEKCKISVILASIFEFSSLENENAILAVGTEEGKIIEYDIEQQNPEMKQYQVHSDCVLHMKFYSKNETNYLISSGKDGMISITERKSAKIISQISYGHYSKITASSFLSSKNQLLSADENGGIVQWNLDTQQLMEVFKTTINNNNEIQQIVEENNRLIVSSKNDVEIRNSQTKEVMGQLLQVQPSSITVTASGKVYSFVGDEEGNICVWEHRSNKIIKNLKKHTHKITQILLIEDRNSLISLDEEDNVIQWNTDTLSFENKIEIGKSIQKIEYLPFKQILLFITENSFVVCDFKGHNKYKSSKYEIYDTFEDKIAVYKESKEGELQEIKIKYYQTLKHISSEKNHKISVKIEGNNDENNEKIVQNLLFLDENTLIVAIKNSGLFQICKQKSSGNYKQKAIELNENADFKKLIKIPGNKQNFIVIKADFSIKVFKFSEVNCQIVSETNFVKENIENENENEVNLDLSYENKLIFKEKNRILVFVYDFSKQTFKDIILETPYSIKCYTINEQENQVLIIQEGETDIRIYDLFTYDLVKTIYNIHYNQAESIIMKPNSDIFISYSEDDLSIIVWNSINNQIVSKFKVENQLLKIEFLQNQPEFLALSDKSLIIFNYETGKIVHEFEEEENCFNFLLLEDSYLIILQKRRVASYDIKTKKMITENNDIELNEETKFKISENQIVFQLSENEIKVFSFKKAQIQNQIIQEKEEEEEEDDEEEEKNEDENEISNIFLSESGKICAKLSEKNQIQLWNIEQDKEISQIQLGPKDSITEKKFSKYQQCYATVHDDEPSILYIWSLEPQKITIKINVNEKTLAESASDSEITIKDFYFLEPFPVTILIIDNNDNFLYYNRHTGEFQGKIDKIEDIDKLKISSNGEKTVVFRSEDDPLTIINNTSFKTTEIKQGENDTTYTDTFDISPNGQKLVIQAQKKELPELQILFLNYQNQKINTLQQLHLDYLEAYKVFSLQGESLCASISRKEGDFVIVWRIENDQMYIKYKLPVYYNEESYEQPQQLGKIMVKQNQYIVTVDEDSNIFVYDICLENCEVCMPFFIKKDEEKNSLLLKSDKNSEFLYFYNADNKEIQIFSLKEKQFIKTISVSEDFEPEEDNNKNYKIDNNKNTLFYLDSDSQFHAIDLNSQEKTDFNQENELDIKEFCVQGDNILFYCECYLYCLNITSKNLKKSDKFKQKIEGIIAYKKSQKILVFSNEFPRIYSTNPNSLFTPKGPVLKLQETQFKIGKLSQDESKLYLYSQEQTLSEWDAQSGKFLCQNYYQGDFKKVRITPDNKYIFANFDDNLLALIKTKNYQITDFIECESESMSYKLLRFSPKGSYVYGITEGNMLHIWESSEGIFIESFVMFCKDLELNEKMVKFSDDERYLIHTYEEQYTKVYDLQERKHASDLQKKQHISYVYDGALSIDSSMFATACRDKIVRLWDVESGRCVKSLSQHSDYVKLVGFSPDGKYLASFAEDNDQSVVIWDLLSKEMLYNGIRHDSRVEKIRFSKDSMFLFTIDSQTRLRIFDLKTGKLVQQPCEIKEGDRDKQLYKVSKDNQALAAIYTDLYYEHQFLQPEEEEEDEELEVSKENSEDDEDSISELNCEEFEEDEQPMKVVSKYRDQQNFKVCEVEEEERDLESNLIIYDLKSYNKDVRVKVKGEIKQICFENEVIALLSEKNKVSFFDRQGKKIKQDYYHLQNIIKINLISSDSSDSLLIVEETKVILLDLTSFAVKSTVFSLKESKNYQEDEEIEYRSISKCRNYCILKTDKYRAIHVNLQTKQATDIILPDKEEDIDKILISSNSSSFTLIQESKNVILYDLKSGKQLKQPLKSPNRLENIKYSANNNYLIIVNNDNEIFLWNLITGQIQLHFMDQDQDDKNNAVRCDSINSYIITFDENKQMLHLFDLESGLLKEEIQLGDENITGFSLMENNKVLLQTYEENEVILRNYRGNQIQSKFVNLERKEEIEQAFIDKNEQYLITIAQNVVKQYEIQSGDLVNQHIFPLFCIQKAYFHEFSNSLVFTCDEQNYQKIINIDQDFSLVNDFSFPIQQETLCLDYSSFLNQIATGNLYGIVQIFDPEGNIKQILAGHNEYVKIVKFVPNSKKLISQCDNYYLIIWDLQTGSQLFRQKLYREIIQDIVFSPNLNSFVCQYESEITIWSLEKLRQMSEIIKSSYMEKVMYSNDGSKIYILPSEKSDTQYCALQVFDSKSGVRILDDFMAFSGNTEHIKISQNKNLFAILSDIDKNQLSLANLDQNSEKRIITREHLEDIQAFNFSFDGKRLVSACDFVNFTYCESGKLVGCSSKAFSFLNKFLIVSENQEYIILANENYVQLRGIESKKIIYSITLDEEEIQQIKFSPDSQYLGILTLQNFILVSCYSGDVIFNLKENVEEKSKKIENLLNFAFEQQTNSVYINNNNSNFLVYSISQNSYCFKKITSSEEKEGLIVDIHIFENNTILKFYGKKLVLETDKKKKKNTIDLQYVDYEVLLQSPTVLVIKDTYQLHVLQMQSNNNNNNKEEEEISVSTYVFKEEIESVEMCKKEESYIFSVCCNGKCHLVSGSQNKEIFLEKAQAITSKIYNDDLFIVGETSESSDILEVFKVNMNRTSSSAPQSLYQFLIREKPPLFSFLGKNLVFTQNYEIQILDIETGKFQRTPILIKESIEQIQKSCFLNEKYLLLQENSNLLKVLSAKDLSCSQLITMNSSQVSKIEASKYGNQVATVSENDIVIWNAEEGIPLYEFSNFQEDIQHVFFLRNNLVLVIENGISIHKYSLNLHQEGQLIQTLMIEDIGTIKKNQIFLSKNEEFLYMVGDKNQLQVISLENMTKINQNQQQLQSEVKEIKLSESSPHACLHFKDNGNVQLVNLNKLKQNPLGQCLLAPLEQEFIEFQFFEQGKYCFILYEDYSLRIYNMQSQEEKLLTHTEELKKFSFQKQNPFFFFWYNDSIALKISMDTLQVVSETSLYNPDLQLSKMTQNHENIILQPTEYQFQVLNLGQNLVLEKLKPEIQLKEIEKLVFIPGNPVDKLLVYCSSSEELLLYSLDDYSLLNRNKNCPHGSIETIELNPKKAVYATAGYEKIVNIWNCEDGNLLQRITGFRDSVLCIAFSNRNGQYMATGDDDSLLKIMDWKQNKTIQDISIHSKSILSTSFSCDDCYVAAGSKDEKISLFNMKTKQSCLLLGHNDYVTQVKFHPKNPNILISASDDEMVIVWNVKTHQRTHNFFNSAIEKLEIGPFGNSVSVLLENSKIGLINPMKLLEKGNYFHREPENSIDYYDDDVIESFIINSFQNKMATISRSEEESTARIWDISSKMLIRTEKDANCVAFSNHKHLAIIGKTNKTAIIIDTKTGKQFRNTLSHEGIVTGVDFDPKDPDSLATASTDNRIRIWSQISLISEEQQEINEKEDEEEYQYVLRKQIGINDEEATTFFCSRTSLQDADLSYESKAFFEQKGAIISNQENINDITLDYHYSN